MSERGDVVSPTPEQVLLPDTLTNDQWREVTADLKALGWKPEPPNAALERLCLVANEIVAEYSGERRPSWAPALILEGEIVDVLRELEWLAPDEKSIARLWARYRAPANGSTAWTCNGFELRAGSKRSGKRIYETWRRHKDGVWCSGPAWLRPKDPERGKRFLALLRATELGAQRVAEFAGHPHEQMAIGGVFAGFCAICGRSLSDPISLERGIGPECWGRMVAGRDFFARQVAE